MRTRLHVLILLLLPLGNNALSAADLTPAHTEYAHIYWHQVAAPFGKVLLVRAPSGICAIRFTDHHRSRDEKPQTTFDSGEETVRSVYEWHFFAGAKDSLSGLTPLHGTAEVASGALKGVGRLSFQTKDPVVHCGPIRARWLPPSSLSFSEDSKCASATYDLAPTRETQVVQVRRNTRVIQDSAFRAIASRPNRSINVTRYGTWNVSHKSNINCSHGSYQILLPR
jgi:hypothetical protein